MSEQQILYRPSEWQQLFHNIKCPDGRPIDELLGAGSAGPGKTTALIADPLPRLMQEHQRATDRKHPFYFGKGGSVGWGLLVRREGAMLNQTIERCRRLYTAVDPTVKWKQTHQTGGIFQFYSGYKLQLGGCKDVSSWESYQGLELDWIGYDELNQFEEVQYTSINTRNRSSDPLLKNMCVVRAVSNPVIDYEGLSSIRFSDPMWVRKYFVDPHPTGKVIITKQIPLHDGTVRKYTRIYLPATVYDNPDKDFVKEYEAKLKDKPKHIREAMLYGNWYFTPGQFFEDWDPVIHTCNPFSIPSTWKVGRAMDWGFKLPGIVLWFAIDTDGDMWIFHELKFQGKTASEVATMIKTIEQHYGLGNEHESFLMGAADTQLWEMRGDTTYSKADTMADCGVLWEKANKKSLANDAQRVAARIKGSLDGNKEPGLHVFTTCSNLIQTLPTRQKDPKDHEVPLDGGDDHAYDACRYAVSFVADNGTLYDGARRREREERSRRRNEDEENDGYKEMGYTSSGYG